MEMWQRGKVCQVSRCLGLLLCVSSSEIPVGWRLACSAEQADHSASQLFAVTT